MRHALILAALAAAVSFLAPSAPAQAQVRHIYPWCHVQYEGIGRASSSNCGFDSFAQCDATRRGIGGQCEQNTEWLARPQPVSGHRKVVRHN